MLPLQVVFNPKDTNTFASASLDRTIKVSLHVNRSVWLLITAPYGLIFPPF